MFLVGGRTLTDDDVELLLHRPCGPTRSTTCLHYAGVGTAGQVRGWLDSVAKHAASDELILVSSAVDRVRHPGLPLDLDARRAPGVRRDDGGCGVFVIPGLSRDLERTESSRRAPG